MEFMRYEADDRGSPGLAGLFDHLSGFKNRLVDFHLGYDVSETALVLILSKQTAELVMEALQRALGITTHEAKVRLSAAISALAKLSQLDDTARSLNKRMIEFRISGAEGIVAERPVAN